jgi:hypothetical protein
MNAGSVVAIAWVVLAAACAPAGQGTRSGDSATGSGEAAVHVIAAAPSTHVLRLDDSTRECLARRLQRGDLDIARLTLVDLRPRAAQALKGVRVFVDMPDAYAATPRVAASEAGAFVLGLEPRETVILNIAPALKALWRAGDLTPQVFAEDGALRLTFVAEPWDFAASLPDDFALPFARATLEVPCVETEPSPIR